MEAESKHDIKPENGAAQIPLQRLVSNIGEGIDEVWAELERFEHDQKQLVPPICLKMPSYSNDLNGGFSLAGWIFADTWYHVACLSGNKTYINGVSC